MPNLRAIALSESPLSLVCCRFSHRALWRAVGILCCSTLDLRGLRSRSTSPISNIARWGAHRSPALLIPQASPELSGGAVPISLSRPGRGGRSSGC